MPVRGVDMREKAQLMDEAALSRALMRISHEIVEKNKGAENVVLVGIRRRGGPIAERIRDNIRRIESREVPVGSIDIRFYRDDLSHESERPPSGAHDAALQRDGQGRGAGGRCDLHRAHSARRHRGHLLCGRLPRSVQLAVLVDRGHRELPIRPDYVGKNVPSARTELIEVRLPDFDSETGVWLMEIE